MNALHRASAVERALKGYLEEAGLPLLLTDSMAYSLLNGGKRVRACLLLASAEMLGAGAEAAMPFACALEMVHAYSLVHDDLPAMDDDAVRRGKPSSHIRYGEANAILTGDALLTLAMWVLSRVDGHDAAKTAIARGALDMAAGQSMDVNSRPDTEQELIALHENKTGALFLAAATAGAVVAGADKKAADALAAYARSLGMLFQLTDDLLDREQDEREDNVSFATFCGEVRTRQLIEQYRARCSEALRPFGDAAAELTALSDMLAERTV